jgi:hypothetical protein
MKDDFPAEWLPMKITTIFFRGGSSLRSKCSAILMKPGTQNRKQVVGITWWFLTWLYSVHFKF